MTNLLNRIDTIRRETHAHHAVICGARKTCIIASFLASREGGLDGVLVADDRADALTAEEASGLPVFTVSRAPFPLHECLVVLAMPVVYHEQAKKQMEALGCKSFFRMTEDDHMELSQTAGEHDFLTERLMAAVREHGEKSHLVLMGEEEQVRTICSAARMSSGGGQIEAVLVDVPREADFFGVPVYSEKTLPFPERDVIAVVCGGGEKTGAWRGILTLSAAEIFMAKEFSDFRRSFFDYFRPEEAAEFGGYGRRARRILAAYEIVNICCLDADRLDSMAEVLLSEKDEKEHLVFVPRFSENGRVHLGFRRSVQDFLFEKIAEKFSVVTTRDERNFWGWFMRQYPERVRFSDDFGHYSIRMRQLDETGKIYEALTNDGEKQKKTLSPNAINSSPNAIDSSRVKPTKYQPISFSADEKSRGEEYLKSLGLAGAFAVFFEGRREDVRRMVGDRAADSFSYDEEKVAKEISLASKSLAEHGIRLVRLSFSAREPIEGETIFRGDAAEPFMTLFLISRARFFACGHFAFATLAALSGTKLLLFNMPSVAWTGEIAPRIDAENSVMMPPKAFSEELGRPLTYHELYGISWKIPNLYEALAVLSSRGAIPARYTYFDLAIYELGFIVGHTTFVENTADEIMNAAAEIIGTINIPGISEIKRRYDSLLTRAMASRDKVFPTAPPSFSFLYSHRPILGIMYTYLQNFTLESVLPAPRENAKKKITVRIYCPYNQVLETLKTLMDACRDDGDIDLLMLTKKKNGEADTSPLVTAAGCRCAYIEEYDVAEDKPDVLVLSDPGEILFMPPEFGDIRRHSRLMVVAVTDLIRCGNGDNYQAARIDNVEQKFSPDYYLFDSLLYRSLIGRSNLSEKIVEMGNGKYDRLYLAAKRRDVPDGWGKLVGKRVVMWAADHGLLSTFIMPNVTFDIYAAAVFKYFDEHPDMGLILRPHAGMFQEFVGGDIWSAEDFERFREYCASSPNIVLDERPSYGESFGLADAIVVDAGCGITATALPLALPTCLAFRSPKDPDYEPELFQNYYRAYEPDGLIKFLEMVRAGADPMYEMRKAAIPRFVKHFDGKNGWRIKEFLKEKFIERFGSK